MKIGLWGSSGRMGLVIQSFSTQLNPVLCIERNKLDEHLKKESKTVDIVIDFSSIDGTRRLLTTHKKWDSTIPLIIGTTGLEAQKLILEFGDALSKRTYWMWESNFSMGAQILATTLEKFGRQFQNLGFDASILDLHHASKKDSPSGTAKRFAQALNSYADVPIESIRQGDFIGTHTINFKAPFESLSFTHQVTDRKVFGTGALECAKLLFELSKKENLPRQIFAKDLLLMLG